jgi:hypothetical protein
MLNTAHSSPSPSTSAFRTLGKHIAQVRVVFVFVDMMYAYMSVHGVNFIASAFIDDSLTYLCRLSGRGYLCSRSGQNGQT